MSKPITSRGLSLTIALLCLSCDPGDNSLSTAPGGKGAVSPGGPQTIAMAEFNGYADPRNGKFVITTSTNRSIDESNLEGGAGIGSRSQALDQINVARDNIPESGPADSVELETRSLAFDEGGCSVAQTLCATIRLRSFYSVPVASTWVQITYMNPDTNHRGTNSVDGSSVGLSNTYGLWSYGGVGDTNAYADQTWRLQHVNEDSFVFKGIVWGTILSDGICGTGPQYCSNYVCTCLEGEFPGTMLEGGGGLDASGCIATTSTTNYCLTADLFDSGAPEAVWDGSKWVIGHDSTNYHLETTIMK